MLKKLLKIFLFLFSVTLLTACGSSANGTEKPSNDTNIKVSEKKMEGRWYTDAQRKRGGKIFSKNCAVCHGAKGQGLAADWKKTDANGKFPAPPLNGTAHTWHHSKSLLLRTVNEGGVALGGTMPAFKNKLTDEEKEAVLAHVMSLWPKETYDIWQKRNSATK